MIDTELAPHQRELAEFLGKKPDPGPADGLRGGLLASLRENPSVALEGLRITIGEHTGQAAQSQMLADLALKFSENTDRAEPEPVYRPCGSPGARVNLTRAGKPVRVPLTAETGATELQRLCDEHREVLDGAGKLQSVLAPGSDGACDWPLRQRPDSVPAWCDLCGATQDLQETDTLGSGDTPCSCHNMVIRPCRDSGACSRRREERYPPDLSRVPSWIFTAQQRLTDEQTREMVLAACGAALSDYLELAAREDAETELELAGQQADAPFYGAYSARGDWMTYQPQVNFNWSHWSHTLRNHAHRQHLISGNGLTPARISAMAKINAARGAQAAPGGTQDGGGQQPARREIPAEGLAPGVAEALHGGVGHDIQAQLPQEPEGAPARPAQRPRDKFGSRRGRRAAFPRRTLKYTGR